MDSLKDELSNLNRLIDDLKIQIEEARLEAQNNTKPLKMELSQIRRDKSQYALKNDFDSVQDCRRREENLKFRIDAQWNRHVMLKGDLAKLNGEKAELERQIRLEKDRLRRDRQIRQQMSVVLNNYKKSQSLKTAAIDSNISPEHVEQWLEWGKNDFNEACVYFYRSIRDIDDDIKNLKAQKTRMEMDRVIEAYKRTGSFRKAAEQSNVSRDTVEYWYKWGSMGFGDDNRYFFEKCKGLDMFGKNSDEKKHS